MRVGVEVVAGYKDAYVNVKKLLSGSASVVKIPATVDMTVRSAPLEPIFEAGNVHIYPGPWNGEWKQEAMEFPAGAHDDRWAATVGGYEMLLKMNKTTGSMSREALRI